MKSELPPQENAASQENSDYEAPRIESVITAEQMERESFYAGGGDGMQITGVPG